MGGYLSRYKKDIILNPDHGGGAPPVPSQMVANRGEINHFQTAVTTSDLKRTSRNRLFIGNADVSELQLVYAGWIVGPDTGEIDNLNSVSVRAHIEIAGVVVTATFSTASVGTLNPGSLLISDRIFPSAFSMSNFPRGMEFYVVTEDTVSDGQSLPQHQNGAYGIAPYGEGYLRGGSGATTKIGTAGELTTAGSWSTSNEVYTPVAVIGKPLSPMMSTIIFGDSVPHGVDAGSSDGVEKGAKGGWLRHGLSEIDSAIKSGRISASRPSEKGSTFNSSHSKRFALLPYVNHVVVCYGGNDYTGGATVNNTITAVRAIRTAIRAAAPDAYIIQYELWPKTDSTDSYATLVNQTPRTGYEIGGAWRDVFNAAMVSDVGGGTLDAFRSISPGSIADGTATDKWVPNLTTDGTHPTEAGHAAMITADSSFWATRRTAYEGAYEFDAATTALVAAMSSAPSASRQALIDQSIRNLKQTGVWDKLDLIGRAAAHHSQAATLNWKNPATFTATLTNAPTFTIDRGYTTNGTTNYVNTNYNPTTAAGLFTQNNCSFSVRGLNWPASDSSLGLGRWDGTDGVVISPKRAGNTGFIARINQATQFGSGAVPNTTGVANMMAILTRNSSTTAQYTHNDAEILADNTTASTAMNNATFLLGTANTTNFLANQFACWYVGGWLTLAERISLYKNDKYYLERLGAI